VSRTLDVALPFAACETHDFEVVYGEHAAFVWRSLRALGVPAAQLDDALQDVFVVVHQKLGEFRGPAHIRTWLFEIGRRVASHYRRAAGRLPHSQQVDEVEVAAAGGTFEEASRKEAAQLVLEVLDMLDESKRELIVMVELEQMPITEVAASLKVPLNTAYSRVRLARKAFAAALARRGEQR
jgi:RNA polymerase sigma-70 factor (ECF subfamily)